MIGFLEFFKRDPQKPLSLISLEVLLRSEGKRNAFPVGKFSWSSYLPLVIALKSRSFLNNMPYCIFEHEKVDLQNHVQWWRSKCLDSEIGEHVGKEIELKLGVNYGLSL